MPPAAAATAPAAVPPEPVCSHGGVYALVCAALSEAVCYSAVRGALRICVAVDTGYQY
jgi:hypothetical protein